MLKGLRYFLGAVLVALAGSCWGQNEASDWRKYKVLDGLPEAACSSVTFTPHGQVLVTHPNLAGITRLTGYGIELNAAPQTGPMRCRVYEGSGGQLWTVAPNGLLERRGDVWSLHIVPEIASLSRSNLPSLIDPIPLCPVRQGYVLLLFPDRLAGFQCDDPVHPRLRSVRASNAGEVGLFSSMCPARDGGLWIAGARGLAKVPGPVRTIKPESDWREYLPPPAAQLQNFHDPHEDRNGDVTLVADSAQSHQRVVAHFDGRLWTVDAVGSERIRFAWRALEGTGWAATASGLFQYEETGTEMVENEEVSARKYNDLAIEPGGAFWLATSDGLFRYSPLAWRPPHSLGKFSAPVSGITADVEGRLWFAAGAVLHSIRNERHEEFPFPATTGRRVPPHARFCRSRTE